ncbi:MAG: hypothetical protein NCW75_04105 [Phycisphaera sp.]|nr:MAG: hypothetical protein NCW75_04105 [Phycisphaera sp.]
MTLRTRPSPDDLLTWEVSVVRTTRETHVVEAIDDNQAFECYLKGDSIDIFEDELCSHYEGTTLREEHQESLSHWDLLELLDVSLPHARDGR